MATVHPIAADADPKTTMNPSPRFLTSAPPASVMAWRRIEKWPRRTSSAAWDRRWDSSVEPTMSVKSTATFSVSPGFFRLQHASTEATRSELVGARSQSAWMRRQVAPTAHSVRRCGCA